MPKSPIAQDRQH
jgi:hypothetical protein